MVGQVAGRCPGIGDPVSFKTVSGSLQRDQTAPLRFRFGIPDYRAGDSRRRTAGPRSTATVFGRPDSPLWHRTQPAGTGRDLRALSALPIRDFVAALGSPAGAANLERSGQSTKRRIPVRCRDLDRRIGLAGFFSSGAGQPSACSRGAVPGGGGRPSPSRRAGGPLVVSGLARGANRLSAGGRRHASTEPDRLDAQSRAHGGGVVPCEGSAAGLALGRALLHEPAARCGPGREQRQLAMVRLDRHGRHAWLSDLQPGATGEKV